MCVLTLLGEANITHALGLPFIDSGVKDGPQDGGGGICE